MNSLNEDELKYSKITDYITELVDLFILMYDKWHTYDDAKLIATFRKQWDKQLCQTVITRLNESIYFLSEFNRKCFLKNDKIVLEAIELDKIMIRKIISLLSLIHMETFQINHLKEFIHEQSKKKKEHAHLVENIEYLLPNPPDTVPIVTDVIQHLKLFGFNDKKEREGLKNKNIEDLIKFER